DRAWLSKQFAGTLEAHLKREVNRLARGVDRRRAPTAGKRQAEPVQIVDRRRRADRVGILGTDFDRQDRLAGCRTGKRERGGTKYRRRNDPWYPARHGSIVAFLMK